MNKKIDKSITKSLFAIGFMGVVITIIGSPDYDILPQHCGFIGIIFMCIGLLGGIANMAIDNSRLCK